jgi:hypothetical protein
MPRPITNVEFDAEKEATLAGDNPLVQELINVVLREAQRIVKDNTSQFTAEQLLEAAQYWLPSNIARLRKRKVSAWNLALRHEKEHAPVEVLKKKPGVGRNGQQGLTGDYAHWLSDRWKTDPELRKKYEELANTTNQGESSVDDNAHAGDGEKTTSTLEDQAVLKKTQKQSARELLKHVRALRTGVLISSHMLTY